MSPDTLPAPRPIRRDTRALQPPAPPLIPSRPTGLRGRRHSLVTTPELGLLGRGGDTEEEMRGGELKPQPHPPPSSPHLPTSPLFYPSGNSLQKLGQQLSTFYQRCVFQTETAEVRSRTILTRQKQPLICRTLRTVNRHPSCETRIQLHFQPRGYYYLIPSPVMHTSADLNGPGSRVQHSLQPCVKPKRRYFWDASHFQVFG